MKMKDKKNRIPSNKRTGKYENWEHDFLRLAYPLSNASEIAEILNRPKAGVNKTAKGLGLINKGIIVTSDSRFGMLKPIEKIIRNNKKMWKCQCDCGSISYCTNGTLVSGHSRSCGCNRLKVIYKGGKYISGSFFKHIKDSAMTRNLEFTITIEYLDNLFESQNMKCMLTGETIYLSKNRISKEYYEKTTASLDRIDNNIGYIEGNVQFLHKEINYMKWTHNQDYFIELCRKVANYAKSN